jgi:hypothetical protein
MSGIDWKKNLIPFFAAVNHGAPHFEIRNFEEKKEFLQFFGKNLVHRIFLIIANSSNL